MLTLQARKCHVKWLIRSHELKPFFRGQVAIHDSMGSCYQTGIIDVKNEEASVTTAGEQKLTIDAESDIAHLCTAVYPEGWEQHSARGSIP
jgi:hypothetical protein